MASDPAESRTGCHAEGGRHFAVVSPVRWLVRPQPHGDCPDPGEEGRYYAEVIAPTRRAARVAACRTNEFSGWVTEARGDNQPPMAGLEVEEMLCEHGLCWGCVEECPECEAEDRQRFEDEMAEEQALRDRAACRICNDEGQVWDPRVNGNVVMCDHLGAFGSSGAVEGGDGT